MTARKSTKSAWSDAGNNATHGPTVKSRAVGITKTASRDWIREHKEEVAIGTVVIVGGVVFVLSLSPPGWLVLIPMGVAAT
jgi:hypothetical protein